MLDDADVPRNEVPDVPRTEVPDASGETQHSPQPPWAAHDAVSRPVPVARDVANPAPGPGRAIVWLVAGAALLLAILSLVINGLLIRELRQVRTETAEILDATVADLDDVTFGGLDFSYVFSETIVTSGTVPISQTVVFPFQGTVPFKGRVPFEGVVPIVINVPVLGAQTFRVPIETDIDVDTVVDVSTTVTVPVEMAFPFDVAIPVRMPIDVEVSLDDQPALMELVDSLQETLVEVRERLVGD